MKLEKYVGNPILSPNPRQPWESIVVCNPGVIYDKGTFYMLYRCAGNDPAHIIRFGLATSMDGFNFKRSSAQPVLSPSAEGEDAGCIEVPRIVKLGGRFLITYAYRPYFPRRYWLAAGNAAFNPRDQTQPKAFGQNLTSSGLLMTTDFKSYRRLGRITDPTLDDRDVILFPEKIDGQFALLRRPMQWTGKQYGTKYPAIWICFGHDPLMWGKDHLPCTSSMTTAVGRTSTKRCSRNGVSSIAWPRKSAIQKTPTCGRGFTLGHCYRALSLPAACLHMCHPFCAIVPTSTHAVT